jgi:nitroreductase
MPDFYEVLKTRRSVRAYTDRPVDEKELKEVIDLAAWAPSGNNKQPWTFTVITNQGLMDRLNDRVKAVMRESPDPYFANYANDPSYHIFYKAPALILIYGDVQVPSAMIDCQLTIENLFLAAHAKGLGTCYMGFLLLARDDLQVRQLLRGPDARGLMAATVIGYPAVTPPAPPRKAVQIEWVR